MRFAERAIEHLENPRKILGTIRKRVLERMLEHLENLRKSLGTP